MTREKNITIRPDGTIVMIVDKRLAGLNNHGPVTTRRASHVEPKRLPIRWLFHLLRWWSGENGSITHTTRQWTCLWRVNMKPSGGPILKGYWYFRDQAIEAEVRWLEANVMGR